MIRPLDAAALVAAAILLIPPACTTIPAKPGFSEVEQVATERLNARVEWRQDSEDDARADEAVRELLSRDLTAESAVQIALLNNRRLQARYEDLGVSQAALVQAGLLSNPVFSAGVAYPEGGGLAELAFGVAKDFLDVFTIPLRKRIAGAEFEVAKHTVALAVIDLAAETREAFIGAQADAQTLELLAQIVESTSISADVMQRLYDAGNVRDLDLAQEQALASQARLDLARAQISAVESRERLNALMGLWAEQTTWTIASRLPDVPQPEASIEDVERIAIERSAALAAMRARIVAAGERLGIENATGLVPMLDLGVHAEREDGHWEGGPEIGVAVPIFDQGQARQAAARAELRRAQQAYFATAVETRAAARAARDIVRLAHAAAVHQRDVAVPIRARIVEEMQLEYNAMQVGVFDLIAAKQQAIDAARRQIASLRDYWMARSRLDRIFAGGSASPSGASSTDSPEGMHESAGPSSSRSGGH